MGTETDESVHASETLGPAQGTAPSTGQESLPADFSRAVALLRRPVAQPVIDALLMDPDALIEAAKNILPRVPRSRKEIRRNEERPWKSQAGNDLNLSAAQIDAVVDSSTVGRLRRRYEVLLQNVDLPTEGFTTKDQAQAAGRLVSTYNNLRKRQLELGLKTTPKDDRITEAHRLRVAFQRQEKKSRAAAPTRRGRPPRVATLG